MRCYIWGTNNQQDRTSEGRGVACFAIPDWGLQFRAAQMGSAADCEFAALLAFLKFVENNPRAFEGHSLQIFSDSSLLVEQLKGSIPVDPIHQRAVLTLRGIRDRIKFEMSWVPPEQNRAIEGVLDLPPLKTKFQIQHTPPPKKSPDSPSTRFKS